MVQSPQPDESNLENPQESPLRSVHTTNFAEILGSLSISLLVSTYQAGKLIVVRNDNGVLNTHFRLFNKPMGLAAERTRLAIGVANEIIELANIPAVASKIEPRGKHDACYMPRSIHVTGDIDIHEMAWGTEDLWFINTRFCCLCTIDKNYSFVPRWRPKFVSALTPEDRCHLNGLGMVNGEPKYVSALGTTDTLTGWRENKAKGGVLLDITNDQQIAANLSMPHSPRWYGERLWVLESGNGSLATVNLATGQLETVALLPGFTRGIDFFGPLAFIGLSQVRETAVFSGIPITERLQERICGVWVVNILTGQTIAFLKFEEAVQEIFAVQVLPGITFPEVIDSDLELISSSYVLPDEALKDVPQEKKQIITEIPQKSLGQAPGVVFSTDWQSVYNLGIKFRDEENWLEAKKRFEQVLDLKPECAQAYNNLGIIYNSQNQVNQAIVNFEQAVKLEPHFADAHYNLGMALLKAGDLVRGFAECEWRWQTEQFTPLNCPQPLWDGKPLRGQTILIHTEQGAGDAIQFIRYIPQVASRCEGLRSRIILFCTEDLLPLFSSMPGIDKVLTPGTISLSEFQAYAPLMSLPNIFGTTLETIPAQVPYLKAPSARHLRLKAIKGKPFKVGIAWSGSHTYSNNHNRACRLLDFIPLFEIPGVRFYSLQKGAQVAELASFPLRDKIQDLSEKLSNFADTAVVISQLDLVITVDTAVAHLAGALGKPVWTMLCYAPDWRWMLATEKSPWYPTMRLFRQKAPKDWQELFSRVTEALWENVNK